MQTNDSHFLLGLYLHNDLLGTLERRLLELHLVTPLLTLDETLSQLLQDGFIGRLVEIVVCPCPEGFACGFEPNCMGSHDNVERFGKMLLESLQHRDTARVGRLIFLQAGVNQYEVGAAVVQQLKGSFEVVCVEPLKVRELLLERLIEIGQVIVDENAGAQGRRFWFIGVQAKIKCLNLVPLSGELDFCASYQWS